MAIVPAKPISSPVLIGRQTELGALRGLVDQAGQGQGS